MKLRQNLFLFLLSAIMLFFSCTKEKSFEKDKIPARGTLQSDIDGTCLPKTVKGNFIAAKALNSENYLELSVSITSPGSYFISTDTLNGYFFRGTGSFKAGTNTIRLTASGTPHAAGTNNFLIAFDSSYCYIPVTVLPAGTTQAVFTLQGSGSNCMDATVSGTYSPAVVLTADNKVTIKVDVTTAGTYSITTTTVNGMTFAGSGLLTATGPQEIILTGNGTPVNKESSVITVNAGNSSCTFTVNVENVSAIDYFPRTTNSNWTYSLDGDINDSIRSYVIPQTITAAGNTYNLFMVTDGSATDTLGAYRRSGSEYHRYFNIGAYLGLDNSIYADITFLKDNVPAGTTWTSDPVAGTAGGLTVKVRTKFSIVKKGGTLTVNGVSYSDIIAVKTAFEADAGSGWIDISASTYYLIEYYAPNVGLIKTEYLDGTNALLGTDDLIRYQVF